MRFLTYLSEKGCCEKILLISTFLIIVLVSACSNEKFEDDIINPIAQKIYIIDDSSGNFDFEIVKFYDDKTFEGIHTYYYYDPRTQKNEPGYDKYYGAYEINERSIILKISNETLNGVISDDSQNIRFGNDRFTDWTEHIGNDDPILSEFEK